MTHFPLSVLQCLHVWTWTLTSTPVLRLLHHIKMHKYPPALDLPRQCHCLPHLNDDQSCCDQHLQRWCSAVSLPHQFRPGFPIHPKGRRTFCTATSYHANAHGWSIRAWRTNLSSSSMVREWHQRGNVTSVSTSWLWCQVCKRAAHVL